MPDTITWVHDEMLSPAWIKAAQPAVFVFDDDWIRTEKVSLKRIVFLYECVLEMPGVTPLRGDVVESVRAFAAERGATRIETVRSEDPRLKRQAEALGAELIEKEPFVDLPADIDLKRFSRYWRKAERRVLSAKK
ncbi:MAG: hypothetical protein AAFV43_02905 [Planctomycetota bacterium]